MKQAIRALGWAVYVVWLVILVFTVTVVYSAFQLGVNFGEVQTSASGGSMILSLPFSIENNGFYEISDLNITTLIHGSNGAPLSNSTTVVGLISSGNKVDAMHNVSISLEEMATASLSRLLFYDTNLNVNMSLALNYAGVVPFKISTNFTIPWGAPLSNLTMGNPYFRGSSLFVPIIFENHSFFNLTGTMRLELFDDLNQQVGLATTPMNVPSHGVFNENVEVSVSGSPTVREARLYFDTSVFSYGPVVIPVA